jgi:hypothetical protein
MHGVLQRQISSGIQHQVCHLQKAQTGYTEFPAIEKTSGALPLQPAILWRNSKIEFFPAVNNEKTK